MVKMINLYRRLRLKMISNLEMVMLAGPISNVSLCPLPITLFSRSAPDSTVCTNTTFFADE